MSNETNNSYYTGQASQLLRQVSFACIAVIWLFKKEGSNSVFFEFRTPLILLIVTLFLDFFQYLSGSILSHTNDEFSPKQENILITIFYFKIIVGIIAVVWMIIDIILIVTPLTGAVTSHC